MSSPPGAPQPVNERCFSARSVLGIGKVIFRPLERFVAFFGLKGFVAIISLIATAFAFFWAWEHEEWQPFVSAAAGGLAALLAALTQLLKDDEAAAKWVLTIGAVSFSAAFSWYTTTNLTKKVAAQTELALERESRLELLRDDIIDYVRALPKDHGDGVIAAAGTKLRDRYNNALSRKPPLLPREFDSSEDIIYMLNRLDQTNGHAIYISGEIERVLGGVSKGRQRFYEYLGVEKGSTRAGDVGVAGCRNARGYCRERTAWIYHLLANDFYENGKRLKAEGHPDYEYKAALSTALKHACSAIDYFPPDGFNDAAQAVATRALERMLSMELNEKCPIKAEAK